MDKFQTFTIQIMLEAKASEDYHKAYNQGGQHVNISPNFSRSATKMILRLAENLNIPGLEYNAETSEWLFKNNL